MPGPVTRSTHCSSCALDLWLLNKVTDWWPQRTEALCYGIDPSSFIINPGTKCCHSTQKEQDINRNGWFPNSPGYFNMCLLQSSGDLFIHPITSWSLLRPYPEWQANFSRNSGMTLKSDTERAEGVERGKQKEKRSGQDTAARNMNIKKIEKWVWRGEVKFFRSSGVQDTPGLPRHSCERERVRVKELLIGSGCCHVYSGPPLHALFFVEVARLWDSTMDREEGQMGPLWKQAQKEKRGRRVCVSEGAAQQYAPGSEMERKKEKEAERDRQGQFGSAWGILSDLGPVS